MTLAERHAILIRKAISEARAAGVRVCTEYYEDGDGFHVKLTTRREGAPDWELGYIVEAY